MVEKFDLNLYQVSKQGQDKIDSLYDQPILEIFYEQDIVNKNPILYDFLVKPNIV